MSVDRHAMYETQKRENLQSLTDSGREFILAQAGKSESSKKQARIISSGFTKYAKKKSPEEWTKEDVIGYTSFLERDHSRNTLYCYFVCLRSFLKYCNREDLAEFVNPPKRPIVIRAVPTYDEIEKMLELASCLRDRIIIQILTRSGLRVGELSHLEPDDIDLDNRKILVRAKAQWAPKGLKERVVPIDFETTNLLRLYLSRNRKRVIDLSDSQIRRIVKTSAFRANIKGASKITPHTLRHSFAIHFLTSGGDIRSLQKILGHTDLATTAIYLDMTENAVAHAYDAVFEKSTRVIKREINLRTHKEARNP